MATAAQRAFDALSDAQKIALASKVFETMEYDADGRPGSEWSSDTMQALGETFETFGVTFTDPNDAPEIDRSRLLIDFTSGPRRNGRMIVAEVIVGEGDDIEILGPVEVVDEEPDDVFGPILSRILEAVGYTLADPGDFNWSDVTDSLSTPHYEVEIGSEYDWVEQ